MSGVSIKEIYSEIKGIKKDLSIIKYALIPEEEINKSELKEILEIKNKMEKGERIRLKEALS